MAQQRKAGGADVLRLVLGFTFRRWRARRALVAGVAGTMCVATLADIFLPLYAGRLIDSLTSGTIDDALPPFLAMVALGLMMVTGLWSEFINWLQLTYVRDSQTVL